MQGIRLARVLLPASLGGRPVLLFLPQLPLISSKRPVGARQGGLACKAIPFSFGGSAPCGLWHLSFAQVFGKKVVLLKQ